MLPFPPLKLGHTDPRFDADPSVGRVKNLRLADAGHTLLGDFVDMPDWVYEMLPDSYPQRSIEATFNLEDNGRTYRMALTAVALLGAQWPAISTLDDLRDLYT